jgi:hypothetical protein
VKRGAAIAALLLLTVAGSARAQDTVPGRVEIGGGIDWIGRASLGSSDATESTSAGPASRIFSTSSVLRPVSGFAAHVNVRVTRHLEAVFETSRAKPAIETTIANDVEATGTVTASETITQYAITAGALWYLPVVRADARLSPFVIGTAGYLRQLHEAATLAATGRIYQAGGGVKLMLSSGERSFVKGLGVRGDVRIVARTKGVAFDSQTLYSPSLGVSVFARF